MKVEKISEHGYYEALYGLGLSHGLTTRVSFAEFMNNNDLVKRVENRAVNLSDKDKGHNKFLESIEVWLICDFTRYLWSEADTYRLSTKQSESTMHKQELRFQKYHPRNESESLAIAEVEAFQQESERLFYKLLPIDIELAKAVLVESLLQKREWKLSYKALRNIIEQRKSHRLTSWKQFCKDVLEQVDHPELLIKENGND